jgi:hypothetical protein
MGSRSTNILSSKFTEGNAIFQQYFSFLKYLTGMNLILRYCIIDEMCFLLAFILFIASGVAMMYSTCCALRNYTLFHLYLGILPYRGAPQQNS